MFQLKNIKKSENFNYNNSKNINRSNNLNMNNLNTSNRRFDYSPNTKKKL